jgi:hypothetical protein
MNEAHAWDIMDSLFLVMHLRICSSLGGNEVGPFLSSTIIQSLEMRWGFWIVGMFCFLNFITMVLYFPETQFRGPRPTISNIPENGIAQVQVSKKTWREDFRVFNGINHNVRFWRVFSRPFVLLGYPTVLFASVMWGMALSWNVILGTTIAQLFSPPYSLIQILIADPIISIHLDKVSFS